jgi:hypothetical protein
MTSSNLKIQRVCEWCGELFYAQKVITKYYSHTCNSRTYKATARNKRIQETEIKAKEYVSKKNSEPIKEKEFLSFSETGTLLGLSRQAIYKMVVSGHLKASKISSRLSFIKV